MPSSEPWSATAPSADPGAAETFPRYLKLDIADFVPGLRAGRFFRSAWGIEPGLPVAVDDPVAKIDLRGRRHVTPEELALDHSRIVVIPVEQPGGVILRDGAGRAEYTANYVGMLGSCGAPLAAAVATLADQIEGLGSVIGCSIGRDRTGVLTALVLRGLGVPADVIQSGEIAMRERLAALVDLSPHTFEGMTRTQVSSRLRAAHESIGDVLAHCERTHGDVRAYLAAHGLEDKVWTRIEDGLAQA